MTQSGHDCVGATHVRGDGRHDVRRIAAHPAQGVGEGKIVL
jgi:hypothetical protein